MLCGSSTHNIAVHPLMDAIVNGLPSPAFTPEINGTKPGSEQEVTFKCDEKSPLSALVFKTISDPYVGKLTYFRVFSGSMKADNPVFNSSKDKEERVGQIFVIRGKTQMPVREIAAGDIGAVPKLSETATGDTLCDKGNPILLPGIEFPDPIMSLAVEPKSKGDEDKLSTALARLAEEDPTFRSRRDAEVKQTIISGMGEAHLEIVMERMARKFGVEVNSSLPRVPYRESVKRSSKAEGKHKKQTGGHGQFGIAWVEVAPQERGSGFEFIDKIVGGAIPRQFIPSVEKGVRKAMEDGFLAGYPIVDLSVKLYDGKFHPVDSSDMSFQIAGALALRAAIAWPSDWDVTFKLHAPYNTILEGTAKQGRIERLDVSPKAGSRRYRPITSLLPPGREFDSRSGRGCGGIRPARAAPSCRDSVLCANGRPSRRILLKSPCIPPSRICSSSWRNETAT